MSTSKQNIPTLIERFYHWEKTTPDTIFLRQPKGKSWKEITYAQAGQEARKMLTALQAAGLQQGDHIGIYSKNCYHWILADLSIMMGGFVSVPFYASLPKGQLKEVIKMADLKAIFLGKLDDWGSKSEAISNSILAIKFPHYEGNAKLTIGKDWNEFIGGCEPQRENFIPNLDDLWTILFTSGTTGIPKGVMHAFRSPSMIMINELKTDFIGVQQLGHLNMLSYLPLNHVGERIGLELPVLWMGGTISFGESLQTFAQNLQDVQPVMFFSVPRIWNKFYLAVSAKIPPKRLSILLKTPLLGKVLKNKIRKGMGMKEVKVAATGAAITPSFIKEWYQKLDIHLVEAYGMTEVCGSITNGSDPNTPNDSVGKTIPFGKVRLHPDTGELLLKSPYVMMGYYKDAKRTAEVLHDGWVHSGDRGTIDDNGNVRVIGRVKDAFKTSKGKFVTPNPLEEAILKNDHIEQVCVVGIGIPQPIALVNLSEIGKEMDRKEVEQSVWNTTQQLNQTRANFEKISTLVIQEKAWSVENELLTPTLKVRRTQLNDKFGKEYLHWHETKHDVLWV